ncbi:MAG: 50S ribosomal protein L16 [Zetaproteobacteria bacterium]|nr:50S ribosomal protein L16 [Zetaproteobacteria bacterium]
MLSPKKFKFRKQQKGRIRGQATSGDFLAFGEYAIMATEKGFITARQIESARIAMTRKTKRGGQVWIKIFPDTPISKKPAEVRMGKGKGSVDHYSAKVKAGRVLYEIAGIDRDLAVEALRLAAAKLPVKTRLIVKGEDPWA